MKQLSIFPTDTGSGTVAWTLSVDGASRGNPGLSGIGIVVAHDHAVIVREGFFIGQCTNNEAEYIALIVGLWALFEHMVGNDTILIRSDSQLLVRQMLGHYMVRQSHLITLYGLARRLLQGKRWSIEHVMREYNSDADALANRGIDQRTALPIRWQQQYAQLRS